MAKCWCGDDHEPTCPVCDKCGAPITTGMMAMMCPGRDECEFWPPGGMPEPFDQMLAEWPEDVRQGWRKVCVDRQANNGEGAL